MNIHPMHKKTVTTAIVLEKRVLRKSGQYPVKLRVTFDRRQKFYTLRYVPEKIGENFTDYQKFWIRKINQGISMTETEYKKVQRDNPMEPFKSMRLYLQTQELFAQETIQKLKPFSFEEFENKFFSETIDDQDLFAALKAKAEHLQKEGKISTATIYKSALQSLKGFTGKEKYPFSKVDIAFLQQYEQWMLGRTIPNKKKPLEPRHISRTTISMYLRAVRAIFNECAPEGTPYPFGGKKFLIPGWSGNKRALSQEDVAKIADYPVVDGTMEHRSRDLWLFSYLCNGANFKDLANLRYSNIKGDTIIFERAKTAQKGGNDNEIVVIITKRIGKIIDRWGSKTAGYIFPILQEGMTAQQQHRAVAQAIKTSNKYMKRICALLEIPVATTYSARHSFATVLKRSGASVEFISESLGHRSIKTTMDYLSSFEIETKKRWAEKLLPEK